MSFEINVVINLDNGNLIHLKDFEIKSDADILRFTAKCENIDEVKEFWIEQRCAKNTLLFDYHIKLATSTCRYSYGLAREKGVVIHLVFDKKPIRILAQYQHRDWWTRPAFFDKIAETPNRTASLCLRYTEGYAYFLAVCGKVSKTEISGSDDDSLKIEINNFTEGLSEVEDFAFVCAQGDGIYAIIDEAFEAAAVHHPNKPLLKNKKRYPEMFDYLGWCSWDAFYTDVNEKGLLQKADEFIEKNVPVKWMLIDDGWLDVKDNVLQAFEEDKNKFPSGFCHLTNQLKKEKGIGQVGVWHAIGGYWGGILPDCTFSQKQRRHLYKTKKNKLIPHYQYENGFGFWNDWYDYLRRNGIDFVKVDGQSALKNYYGGEQPIGEVAYGTHRALEAAACSYFDGKIINCMGMAAENIWSRTISSLSRNSDDFVPDNKEGFSEHVLQNVYNALYHGKMYYCDWDMYWTSHFDAQRHAVLRAISGGPIYFSDKIGETNVDAIKPLVYLDGKIIRCDGDGLPTEDCLWINPVTEGTLLKITNSCGENTIMALFNLNQKKLRSAVSLMDINQVLKKNSQYLVYDYFSQKATVLHHQQQEIDCELEVFGVGFLNFIPMKDKLTPIGLIDKYVCVHAIQKSADYDGFSYITIKESGRFAFFSNTMPIKIIANHHDVSDRLEIRNNIYVLNLPETNTETDLVIFYQKAAY